MSKPKMSYFSQEDILHLMISEEAEANSVELSPNITAELNEKGELIGIEIVNASAFVRDAILEECRLGCSTWSPCRRHSRMRGPQRMARRIGVRELKNRASAIVHEVQKSGAEYIVTLQGEPVAVLAPFSQESEGDLRQAQREEALQQLDTLAEQIAQSWRSPETALEMFNRAAADVTSEDLDERESLLGGFAGRAED